MRIKKVSNVIATNGNIVDSLAGSSKKDAPSINAVNNKLNSAMVKDAVVLFEGNTNNDVTLNDVLSNYEYVDIYYNAGKCYQIERFQTISDNIMLYSVDYDTGTADNWGVVNLYKYLKVNSNVMTVKAYNRIWKYEQGTIDEDRKNYIYIRKVIGYK